MTILMDTHGNKCIQATHLTRLCCVRQKCVWNDQGACFYTGEVKIGYKCKLYTEEKPELILPEDYESPEGGGAGRRCWVTATFFGRSALEVTEKMTKYQRRYPTQGYSTRIKWVPCQISNGFFQGMIERFSTCD
jgi:hypothetical protein